MTFALCLQVPSRLCFGRVSEPDTNFLPSLLIFESIFGVGVGRRGRVLVLFERGCADGFVAEYLSTDPAGTEGLGSPEETAAAARRAGGAHLLSRSSTAR